MPRVTFNKNVYLYGKFYDPDKTKNPKDKENYDIIIYAQPLFEKSRTISSLEGFFISEIPLIKKEDKGIRKNWQPVCRRDQIKEFENKYLGKFVTFSEKEAEVLLEKKLKEII